MLKIIQSAREEQGNNKGLSAKMERSVSCIVLAVESYQVLKNCWRLLGERRNVFKKQSSCYDWTTRMTTTRMTEDLHRQLLHRWAERWGWDWDRLTGFIAVQWSCKVTGVVGAKMIRWPSRGFCWISLQTAVGNKRAEGVWKWRSGPLNPPQPHRENSSGGWTIDGTGLMMLSWQHHDHDLEAMKRSIFPDLSIFLPPGLFQLWHVQQQLHPPPLYVCK